MKPIRNQSVRRAQPGSVLANLPWGLSWRCFWPAGPGPGRALRRPGRAGSSSFPGTTGPTRTTRPSGGITSCISRPAVRGVFRLPAHLLPGGPAKTAATRPKAPLRLDPEHRLFRPPGPHDAARHTFAFREKAGRGALGLSGAAAGPMRVWIDDWRAELQGEEFHLQAQDRVLGAGSGAQTSETPGPAWPGGLQP